VGPGISLKEFFFWNWQGVGINQRTATDAYARQHRNMSEEREFKKSEESQNRMPEPLFYIPV
jgi:hypothetical protein